jgi:hypothetical protein
LKELRLAARKTHGDVADVGSVAKIKRIEAGEPPIKMPDVRALCFMYGADIATTEQLAEMALNKDENWWADYTDAMPLWLGKYVALERRCSHCDEGCLHDSGHRRPQGPGRRLPRDAGRRALHGE